MVGHRLSCLRVLLSGGAIHNGDTFLASPTILVPYHPRNCPMELHLHSDSTSSPALPGSSTEMVL